MKPTDPKPGSFSQEDIRRYKVVEMAGRTVQWVNQEAEANIGATVVALSQVDKRHATIEIPLMTLWVSTEDENVTEMPDGTEPLGGDPTVSRIQDAVERYALELIEAIGRKRRASKGLREKSRPNLKLSSDESDLRPAR